MAEAGGVASRVASAGDGVPQVVVHGETGYLIPVEQMTESPFEPVNAEKFSRDLAARINEIMADPAKQKAFGNAGRQRAIDTFSWASIAKQTKALYETLAPS